VIAVVDTGPLYAAVDASDADHARCLAALQTPGLRLVIPATVLAEAAYLVASRMGPKVEAAFLRGLSAFDIEAPSPEDLERMAELVEQYASFPLGATDASVIALAERLDTDLVISLDERHLRAVVPRHCRALRLLPD
jgi:predicted nucleic acid-binding protein